MESLSLRPGAFGWTAIFADFGLLCDEFPGPALEIWELTGGATARSKAGVEVPIRPFLGVVGVARAEAGAWSTIPPYETGGNVDTEDLVQGSTLYLPVKVPGALFSCGDGHAAQGDGEVCGTAIETTMRAMIRLTVVKDMEWVVSLHYEVPGGVEAAGNRAPDRGTYSAQGIDKDLREAARKAVRGVDCVDCGDQGTG